MAESVSVEHGGVTITTNTATEADLRTEMEAPPIPEPGTSDAGGPVRDEKGRFLPKAEAAQPVPAEISPASTENSADGETPARRRDDTLPRHDRIARMNQALAQKAEAERRAAALEAELQRYRQPAAPTPINASPPPVPPSNGHAGPPEPQFEQFADQPDPYTAYLQAWTRWDHALQLAETRAQWETEQAQKARAATFQERLAQGRTQYPDYDQALTQADTLGLQVSAVMQEAIADSPRAADLVYYLATHPEECTQLAEESQQTPVAAATVMRRLLEQQLPNASAPRAVPVTNGSGAAARASVSTAKPPVSPVGHSPIVADKPPADETSLAEHARYWNRKLGVPGTR